VKRRIRGFALGGRGARSQLNKGVEDWPSKQPLYAPQRAKRSTRLPWYTLREGTEGSHLQATCVGNEKFEAERTSRRGIKDEGRRGSSRERHKP